MIKTVEGALKKYAQLAKTTINQKKKGKLTEEEKELVLDTLNKVAETNQLISEIVKDRVSSEFNQELLMQQFEHWSKGESTLIEFKNTYRAKKQ